jgi:hypothetical protein
MNTELEKSVNYKFKQNGEVSLSLSPDYMRRESDTWNRSVEDWVRDYCKRNRIVCKLEPFNYDEDRLVLYFKSQNQLSWFILGGGREFPYFEFL